jgi:lauroyl/myristoyl acyltransferase
MASSFGFFPSLLFFLFPSSSSFFCLLVRRAPFPVKHIQRQNFNINLAFAFPSLSPFIHTACASASAAESGGAPLDFFHACGIFIASPRYQRSAEFTLSRMEGMMWPSIA